MALCYIFEMLTLNLLLLCVGCAFAIVVDVQNHRNVNKHPIILVPGQGMSQAYVRDLTNPEGEIEGLWLDVFKIFSIEELSKKFNLIYEPKTHTYHDNEKYEIIFPGWGDTKTIEGIDIRFKKFGSCFGQMVEQLRSDMFYVPNITLRGAPYDFRRPPDLQNDFNERLKLLIEQTYRISNSSRIVLIGHSMGTMFCLYFLDSQPDEWKHKYIYSYMAVGGPYGGSVKAVESIVSGNDFGIPFKRSIDFRSLERALVSMGILMPDPRLWSDKEPIVTTPKANYTPHDYEQLYKDLGYMLGYQMIQDSRKAYDYFKPPTGIERLICVHGSGIDTVTQLQYPKSNIFNKGFPDGEPTRIMGDGDGTVLLRSLEICKKWPGVEYVVIPKAKHTPILWDKRLYALINKVAGSAIPLDE
ncbi:unnamed protein product [Calicophoron daubneyi]|uniref:Group XV phospholipase A2 n=1 Tax=Calicophoron daubneyi TaxID=300641 RepID=A0AAV2T237_CALDB